MIRCCPLGIRNMLFLIAVTALIDDPADPAESFTPPHGDRDRLHLDPVWGDLMLVIGGGIVDSTGSDSDRRSRPSGSVEVDRFLFRI